MVDVRIFGVLLALQHASAELDWISHPLEPGDWAMVSGDLRGATGGAAGVTLTSRRNASLTFTVPSVDASDAALKFQMPDAATLGAAGAVFDVRVAGANGSIALNAPEVWWFQGDEGNASSPGGWLRVFGRSIGAREADDDDAWPAAGAIDAALDAGDVERARALLDARASARAVRTATAPILRLTSPTTKKTYEVVANESTAYHAWFNLPATLPDDAYSASLSNGLLPGADAATPLVMFESPEAPAKDVVTVATPKPWDATVFRVDCAWDEPLFDRPCGWVGARSTAALVAALAAAKAHGGGVVYLPRGQYYVDGPVVVPDGVVLRGAGRELVSLYFREAPKPADAPTPGYFYSDGASGHRWAVEDLSVYVSAFYHSIFFVAPTCDRFALRRTRVRASAWAMLTDPCPGSPSGDPKRNRGERSAQFAMSQLGEVVYLAGNRNYDIVDNDLLGSNIIIHTGANPGTAGSARYGRIARNELWNVNAQGHRLHRFER